MRLLSSDIVIPFLRGSQRIPATTAGNPKGIRPEVPDAQPPPRRRNHPDRSPHPAAKPLRPRSKPRTEPPGKPVAFIRIPRVSEPFPCATCYEMLRFSIL